VKEIAHLQVQSGSDLQHSLANVEPGYPVMLCEGMVIKAGAAARM